MNKDKVSKEKIEITTTVPIGTEDIQAALLEKIREYIPAAFPDGEINGARLLSELGLSESPETFSDRKSVV